MASRPLVVHVVGARPNYMKVAPVYAELERRGTLEQRLIHTGQHYDAIMKDVFFAELPLPRPHVTLDAQTTEDALTGLEGVFTELRPDLVIVAGDVNSTLAGAVAASKCAIPVCHIESGLRSGDWSMPEERNRVITDHLSTLLLTHSDDADKNLVAEGLTDRISFVGNTMIDTLRANEGAALALEAWREFGLEPGGYVLVTLHRPSLVDDADLLARTISALDDVAESLPVIFPVHPRTRRNLDGSTRILLTEPLPYRQFLSLEAKAAAVVTDSGGIQ
jgi:UDP-N-acetylglucosamine 2-epimerase (non-hydrolysing)